MSAQGPTPVAHTEESLRRAVSTWGSYSWGYADVGADIFVALGLVVRAPPWCGEHRVSVCGHRLHLHRPRLYRAGRRVSGGGRRPILRHAGARRFLGFMAGWAVLLDFTIDIALFAWVTIGYLSVTGSVARRTRAR